MHLTEGDGSCHVVTDAGKLVYLKGKKMEQYDPIIKKTTLITWFEDFPSCISSCPKSGKLLLVFRITVMILISKTEKFFHLIKPDSLFGKN